MSDFEIPEYEANYYAQMPEEIRDAINFRNSGWNLFKESGGEEGMGDMTLSATCLNLMMPDFGDLLCGNPDHGSHNLVYAREAFASSSRLAIALAIKKEWDDALHWALVANETFMPDPDPEDRDSDKPDQYEVIFDGQLAMVLATGDRVDRSNAKRLAAQASNNCQFSESVYGVFFPNREMSEGERIATVDKFTKVAEVATALTRIPAPAFAKRHVAQLILAQSLDN